MMYPQHFKDFLNEMFFGFKPLYFWQSLIGPGIALGGSFLGGDKGEEAPQFSVAPEYPEAKQARGTWWDKVSAWGDEPGYGAIAPDWGDIWEKSKRRLSQYYWGSPTAPGAASKVRASAARRGVSQSPAMEQSLMQMAAQEGQQQQELATDIATKEAEFGERGRKTWLDQIRGIAGLQPRTTAYQPQQDEGYADVFGTLGSSVSKYFGQKGQNEFMEGIVDKILGATAA